MSFRPEIKDDELYFEIIRMVEETKPRTIIEIGSANGLGSTQAFMEGMRRIDNGCRLYCYEIDEERYKELVENTSNLGGNVVCCNASFTLDSMRDGDVVKFLEDHPTMNPAQYGLDVVLGWKKEIENKLRSIVWPTHRPPVVALVDGSPFSGLAETKILIEDKVDVIILDDVCDIKNFDSDTLLHHHSCYEQVCRNEKLRNGYSVYRRIV